MFLRKEARSSIRNFHAHVEFESLRQQVTYFSMLNIVLKCRKPMTKVTPCIRFKAEAAVHRVPVNEQKINELESKIIIDFSDYDYDLQTIKSYEERVRQDKSISRVCYQT